MHLPVYPTAHGEREKRVRPMPVQGHIGSFGHRLHYRVNPQHSVISQYEILAPVFRSQLPAALLRTWIYGPVGHVYVFFCIYPIALAPGMG